MVKTRTLTVAAAVGFALAGLVYSQQGPEDGPQLPVAHPECTFFGPDHDKYVQAGKNGSGITRHTGARRAALTVEVASALPPIPGDSRTAANQLASSTNTIDRFIFQALQAANVQPAPPTNDFEFLRRVMLDLTGKIPVPDQVVSFVNDSRADKRAQMVETLLGSPAWLDKWTMFLGDLYQNNSRNTQITRYPQTVTAFNAYIRNSLSSGKPYDQMVREMISDQGTNSYEQGELSYIVGGVVGGGPVQDIWDQQTANIATTFLGLANLNCLLCHNGRGHLDTINLWGSQVTRQQAWGMASFLSHTYTFNTHTDTTNNNSPYYWGTADNSRYTTDYALNTTTGNRPPRLPIGTLKTIAPVYVLSGAKAQPGVNYRVALAQDVTSDFQFARATVNYIWEYFFGIGLVSPSNTFDPARLDPDNPPPSPWTLQPSNPRLLNALAQDFVNSKYDLKALMREIVNSNTYQLSARYNGTWDPTWANLFGRKLVRRLWAEELHDAMVQSSNILPSYNLQTNYGLTTSWAMQLPEPLGTPDGTNGAVNNFLNAFLRGNRDDQPRKGEGSISQALDLMDDNFIMSRIKSTGPATSLLVKNLNLPNDQLVNMLFLAVLSRYPNATEMTTAVNNLQNGGNRNQEAENLLWSLYNKVDFVFNY